MSINTKYDLTFTYGPVYFLFSDLREEVGE